MLNLSFRSYKRFFFSALVRDGKIACPLLGGGIQHSSSLHFIEFITPWCEPSRVRFAWAAVVARGHFGALVALTLMLPFGASAQRPAPVPSTGDAPVAQQQPAGSQVPQSAPTAAPTQNPPASASPEGESGAGQAGAITEAELRQMLVGKTFYLRGGYLDDSLSFNEHGTLSGHSPVGSFTLNLIEIDKVRITKHKVELDGARFGQHFLGALPSEDPAGAVDRVRITPKKKVVKITIDREIVVKPKKVKGKDRSAKAGQKAALASSEGDTAAEPAELSDADQAKAEIAAASPEERPVDAGSVTTTTSPAHAAMVLTQALDNIFASGLDARMMAAMPEFWRLYYRAAAAGTDFRPADAAVMSGDAVDRKAKLINDIEAPSNEYAQQCGVAGMALYHAVIGADGKPEEVAVARPIGFGLDENAVEAIRTAKFEPAMKNGRPVPELLDLVVEFRIYSKRTSAGAGTDTAGKPSTAPLPGPYSVQHP